MIRILVSVVLFSTYAFSSSISIPLDDFDFQDVVEISKLCEVSYGDSNIYTAELIDNGWEIEQLENDKQYAYGVRAINGP